MDQNQIWTHYHEFRREIEWTKIGFSNQVHHLRMKSFKHFSGQKTDPHVFHPKFYRSSKSFKMDSRLRERGFGMHEGKPYDRNSISKLIQMSDEEAKSQGIETIPEIKERISLFLNDLCKMDQSEERTIFIFSHGAFIKNFVDHIMGCNAEIPDDQRSKLKMIPFNCHFHEIQISYDCNKKYYKIIRLNEGF